MGVNMYFFTNKFHPGYDLKGIKILVSAEEEIVSFSVVKVYSK